MKISELIVYLEEIKKKEGDVEVLLTTPDDYWGCIYRQANMKIDHSALPEGPKTWSQRVTAVVFTTD